MVAPASRSLPVSQRRARLVRWTRSRSVVLVASVCVIIAAWIATFSPPTSPGLAVDHTRRTPSIAPSVDTTAATNTTHKSLNSSHITPQKKQQRPVLYLHVGPPKTATTLLQCALCATHSNNFSTALRADGWIYLGTCPYKACGVGRFDEPPLPAEYLPHRFTSWFRGDPRDLLGRQGRFAKVGPTPIGAQLNNSNSTTSMPELSPKLIERLAAQQQQQYNIILIFEGCHRLDARRISVLSQYLQKNYEVRVVVAYRHLYEWLPSKYNSIMKRRRRNWPQKRTADPPFDLWRPFSGQEMNDDADGFAEMFHQIESLSQHPSETVYRNYRHYFDSVKLWNLHNSTSSLLEHFLCRIVVGAPQACATAAALPNQNKIQNPSINLDYDALAVAAFLQKRLPPTAKRYRTALAMQDWVQEQQQQQQHESNQTSTYTHWMPQQCWSAAKLERLRRLSLRVEEHLFGISDDDDNI